MRVEEVMTADAAWCRPDSDLASVARTMGERRCGVMPVVDVDAEPQVVGVVTDRDIALALGTADRRPSELRVDSTMSRPARVCRVDEPVHRALESMREARIRRLPVVDVAGRLVGLLSIDDVVLAAQNVRAGVGRVSYEQAMGALDAICARSTGTHAPTAQGR